MAVPTIYGRLIAAWRDAPEDVRRAWSAGASRLRLFVSGSAALPVPVSRNGARSRPHAARALWDDGDRDGAVDPLQGVRRPGWVGTPLPGVEVRVVNEAGEDVADGAPGELLVRGLGVFREYWARPEATAVAFLDGGGSARRRGIARGGVYRILGRISVDIIRRAGRRSPPSKSRRSSENTRHRRLRDRGSARPRVGRMRGRGRRAPGQPTLTLSGLRDWARVRLSGPKLPRRLVTVPAMPRNSMGEGGQAGADPIV